MESTESPLDVLSRAATMVQDSCPPAYDSSSAVLQASDSRNVQAKELTKKWKKDRRCKDRQLEYLSAAKCKLKRNEDSSETQADAHRKESEDVKLQLCLQQCRGTSDAPLDMSTRRRAPSSQTPSPPPQYTRSPPPYGAPHFTTTQLYQRPSVITCVSGMKPCLKTSCSSPGYGGSSSPTSSQDGSTRSPSPREVRHGHRRELLSGEGGMCDPVIDEHFRRSLGKDYMNLFAENPNKNKNTSSSSSVTVTGLSVDDHFAKALGDTWLKLQAKEKEGSSDHSEVSSCPNSSLVPQRRGLVST